MTPCFGHDSAKHSQQHACMPQEAREEEEAAQARIESGSKASSSDGAQRNPADKILEGLVSSFGTTAVILQKGLISKITVPPKYITPLPLSPC